MSNEANLDRGAAVTSLRQVKRGRILTEQPRPRVLCVGAELAGVAERLAEVIATVGHVESVPLANQKEWDCVITLDALATLSPIPPGPEFGSSGDNGWEWRQKYQPHLSIICVQQPDDSVVDCWPPEGEYETPDYVLFAQENVVGGHLQEIGELAEPIQDLVKQSLVPTVRARKRQFGVEARARDGGDSDEAPVQPFLFGPDDLILAGSYPRNDAASVWLVPDDVPDLIPWIVAALRTWNTVNPERFPALPDWHNAEQWRSAEETRLHTELADFDRSVEDQLARLRDDREKRVAAIGDAKERADAFERALLASQHTPLANAVAAALRALGFTVRDMDADATPGQNKEDYRITDPAAADWIALGETKGFTKGVSETGLVSLSRWAAFYVQETGKFPSARWYIANHFLRQDPHTRPDPLRGRDDVVQAFAGDDGLIIDTRALFALLRYTQDNPDRSEDVRTWLRVQTGVLTVAKADDMTRALGRRPTAES